MTRNRNSSSIDLQAHFERLPWQSCQLHHCFVVAAPSVAPAVGRTVPLGPPVASKVPQLDLVAPKTVARRVVLNQISCEMRSCFPTPVAVPAGGPYFLQHYCRTFRRAVGIYGHVSTPIQQIVAQRRLMAPLRRPLIQPQSKGSAECIAEILCFGWSFSMEVTKVYSNAFMRRVIGFYETVMGFGFLAVELQ